MGGYAQLKKSIKGVNAFINGDSRYTIEKTPENFIRATLFGKNALPETREYWDEKDKLKNINEAYLKEPNMKNAVSLERNSIISSYKAEMTNAINDLPESEKGKATNLLKSRLEKENLLLNGTEVINQKIIKDGLTDDYILTDMPSYTIKWTADDKEKEYNMTPAEYGDFTVRYLNSVKKNRKDFVNSDIYNNMTNEQKKDVLSGISSYSEASAKNGLGGYELSDTNKKIKEAQDKGIDPYLFISAKVSASGVEGDKDYSGKTITYSRDINRMKAIKSNIKGLTQKEYIKLFKALGYNEKAIYRYALLP